MGRLEADTICMHFDRRFGTLAFSITPYTKHHDTAADEALAVAFDIQRYDIV